jgi:periplasmic divalent cation tolerance protein
MEQADKIVVFITTSSEEEAVKIARLLLEHRKAACTNIIPRVNSLFWWEGRLESAQESLLVVKTRAALFPELIDLVRKNHSYQVPEIIALPIVAGNEDYLRWLDISCCR